MLPAIHRSLLLSVPLLLMGCARAADIPAPDGAGILAPCPSTPNCVSTEASDPAQRMAPLPYRGVRATSRKCLLAVIEAMPRSTVVTRGDDYLHVLFRSRFFGFVDDAEFVFDDQGQVIRFRSAARRGYWDLGVNRRRLTAMGESYRQLAFDPVDDAPATE